MAVFDSMGDMPITEEIQYRSKIAALECENADLKTKLKSSYVKGRMIGQAIRQKAIVHLIKAYGDEDLARSVSNLPLRTLTEHHDG